MSARLMQRIVTGDRPRNYAVKRAEAPALTSMIEPVMCSARTRTSRHP
ncbi:MAG TPA: hypothetical protein VGR90_03615 [Acidimicrobiales bacterium]|nr:hypothetical protein [Acidimicrobiales bacterium]